MTSHPLEGTIGVSVCVGEARVGKIVGIYLDARREKVIGLEVASAGGVRRFLPWVVASFENGHVRVASALHLLDSPDGYKRRGAVAVRRSSEMVGLSVSREGRVVADGDPVSAGLAAGTPRP